MKYKPSPLCDSTLKAMVDAYVNEYSFVTLSSQRSILKRLRYMNKLLEKDQMTLRGNG